MLLEENKVYRIKELAEWFAIAPSTFSNSRQKYLDILSKYCSFEDRQRKGILIKEVIIPEYIMPSSTRNIVEKEFLDTWKNDDGNLINTCKNVANAIYDKRQEDFSVKPITIYNTTCIVKRDWYGVSKKRGGTKGHCKFSFVVLSDDGTQYRHFTPEEKEIERKLLNKYFSDSDERISQMRGAKKAYKKHEITFEEYQEIIDDLTGEEKDWIAFQMELEEAIHCKCDMVTELIDCGFSEVEGEA